LGHNRRESRHGYSKWGRRSFIAIAATALALVPAVAFASVTVTLYGTNEAVSVDNCITTSYDTTNRAVGWEAPSSCSGNIGVRAGTKSGGTYNWSLWVYDPTIATSNRSNTNVYQVNH
jgi:hypothetical protein